MTRTVYGYCRVSTPAQSIARQRENMLRVYPGIIIYEETYTGATLDRPQFMKLCDRAKRGDLIVFDSVSRMSRSAEEGMQLYLKFFADGIELEFLREPYINTAVYRDALSRRMDPAHTGEAATDKLILGIATAVNDYMQDLAAQQIRIAFDQSQKELDDLRRRTSEGMKAAGATSERDADGNIIKPGTISIAKTGKHIITKKSEKAKRIITQHSISFGGTLSDPECITLAGVSRNSFYKYKRELLKQK